MGKNIKNISKKIDWLRNRIWQEPEFRAFLDGDEPLIGIFDLVPQGKNKIDNERRSQYRNYYSNIGETPIVKFTFPETNSTIHVKLEYKNPKGASHYSRYWSIYLYLAESFGFIKPGKTKLVETTSGSSGIALAEACLEFNYPLTMVVPEALPNARIAPMERAGATIIKARRYLEGCIEEMKYIIRSEKNTFCPDHSRETSDLIVHVFKRIFAEANREINNIDYAVLGIGNGSSVRAAIDYFYKHTAKIVAFEPDMEKLNFKYTFGLRPPNVTMPHVQFVERSLFHLWTIQEADKEAVKDKSDFKQDIQFSKTISEFGESSLYALHFASEYAEREYDKDILILAYDKIDRY